MGDSLKDAQLLEMLKHSIDIHYDAAFWTTPEGEFVYINDMACTSLGYERDELMSLRIWDINPIVNQDPEKWSDVWNQLREQKTIHVESIHVRKDGTEFPVEIVSTCVQFGDQEYICTFARDISERKQVEDALKRAEEAKLENYKALEASQTLYRTTIDAIDHAIHVVDKDLKILVANKELERWAEKYNFEKEFVGKTVREAFPFLPSWVEEEYKTVFATGKPYITEDSNIDNPHGMYTETRKYPVFEGDRVTRIVTSVENISERKVSEKVIIESEERLRATVMNAPIGIATSGPDSVFISANEAFCNIVGYTEEELKERTFSDITHPEDLEKSSELVNDLASGKLSTFNIEKRYIKKDGTVIVGKINCSAIRDYEGAVRLFVAELEDITEKTMSEKALKESEERYRSIIEHSPNYMLLIDNNGTIVDCNKKVISLLNLEPSTIIGSNALDIAKRSNMDDSWIKKMNDTISLEEFDEPVIFSIQFMPDQTMWLKAFITPLEIESGHFYQVVINDITEQKQAEQLIIEELEKLRELSRIQNEFVYRASHELKTPLSTVLSASDLLLRFVSDRLSKKDVQLLKIINKGGYRFKELVDNVLDVMRVDTKNFAISQSWENLSKMVADCLEDLQFQIDQRNLDIVVDIPDDFSLFVDRIRFGQLISNLVSNAIKNTPSNGKIVISANLDAENNNIAELSVKDTGVGITTEEKERLFKIFGKIERYGKGMDIIPEGTGLGLYISKQIVESHGGEIWAESGGRNTGAKFVVRIPSHQGTNEDSI
jgi:hypothetical protein